MRVHLIVRRRDPTRNMARSTYTRRPAGGPAGGCWSVVREWGRIGRADLHGALNAGARRGRAGGQAEAGEGVSVTRQSPAGTQVAPMVRVGLDGRECRPENSPPE
jgi:hypothetical protein